MPARALRPCTHPGCPALLPGGGRCQAHQKAEARAYDERRGSAASRGYDALWRRLRVQFLRQNPLCQCDDCAEGAIRMTLAEVVDHIIPIEERPDLRLDWSNLRAMSKRCHDRHTGRTRGYGRAQTSGGTSSTEDEPNSRTVRQVEFSAPRLDDADG